ncbi:MAG: patatin-like phospholipase family protein, partial [Alphaproteobacteria bacterium]|nr:patatin-like phospholipase family protein [Alphaproteobacteria bacterium]
SGGGIRSATFNLGVMQALNKLGLFNCVDYLSTVSGGGFIGSCISSTMASVDRPAHVDNLHDPVGQIFDHRQGTPEPNIFRHLRDNANYLAPDGLRDVLRIPALLFRGVVVNFLVILPYILAAVMLTIWINPALPKDYSLKSEFFVTRVLLALLVFLFALYPLLHMYAVQNMGKDQRSNWELRNNFGRFLGLAVGAIIVVAFVELQPIGLVSV